MHNFEEKPQCHNIKKYHAIVSLNGETVDVLDVYGHVKGSFIIRIKQGKAILEELINHSFIVIPTQGDVESISPFEYDKANDSISAMIYDIHGHGKKFVATTEDLMDLCEKLFVSKDRCCEDHKPFHPCDKDECHLETEDACKPSKPLIDPYVTKSELMAESQRRQFNDSQILELIGCNKKDNKSIFTHLNNLKSTLNSEIERSIEVDRIYEKEIKDLNKSLKDVYHESQNHDIELRKAIKEEKENREKTCDELFYKFKLLQTENLKMLDSIEHLNKDLKREVSRAIGEERELNGKISKEANERDRAIVKVQDLVRIEETSRITKDNSLEARVKDEVRRAQFAEHKLTEHINKSIATLQNHIQEENTKLVDILNTLKTTVEMLKEDVEKLKTKE